MSATVWSAGAVGAAGIDRVAAEATPEIRKAATKPAAAKRIMRIVESPMGVTGARPIYAAPPRRILRPPVAPVSWECSPESANPDFRARLTADPVAYKIAP